MQEEPKETQKQHLCSGGYTSQDVCVDSNCNAMAFVCRSRCSSCIKTHPTCKIRKWQKIQRRIQATVNSGSYLQSFVALVQWWVVCLIRFLRSIKDKLKKYRTKFKPNQNGNTIFDQLKIKQTEITGSKINHLLGTKKEKFSSKISRIVQILLLIVFISMIHCSSSINSPKQVSTSQSILNDNNNSDFLSQQNPTQELEQINVEIVESSYFQLNSTIVNNPSYIAKLFQPQKIAETKLLYRASEQKFSISKFHEFCDNHPNVLLLLKNQFNRTIGAFSPVPFQSAVGYEYTADNTGTSFLFSLNQIQKLPIMIDQRKNALYNDIDWGPSYGEGCDLRIGEKANVQRNSYSKFPKSFYDPNQRDADIARYRFLGSVIATNFLIEEWQIHEIIFEHTK